MNRPNINVTPLIDVLLVLLIIFMVVSPIKPSAFKSKIASELRHAVPIKEHPDTLVVQVDADGSLELNNEPGLGNANEAGPLSARLRNVFEQRAANLAFRYEKGGDADFRSPDHVERTVFIKAPRYLGYGTVAKVVDAVKIAGAVPISLQVDDLP